MSARMYRLARRFGFALLVAFLLGYLPYRLYAGSGLSLYLKLQAERQSFHRANLETHNNNEKLRRELDGLVAPTGELSRAAIERAARDELGLVKPGEIIYRIEGMP